MDKKAIAMHVVNLSAGGTLHDSRANHTPASQVSQIFDGFARSGLQSMTLYFHGGLVSEAAGFVTAARLLPAIQNDFASYPVFFIWETGPFETLEQSLLKIYDTPLFRKLLSKILKHVVAKLGLGFSNDTLEVAQPEAKGEEKAVLLEAIRQEQLSDEQLMQLTMFEQMPRKTVRKPSKASEKAVRQDFYQDEEAQAVLQSIISNAQQLGQETLEVAPVGDGSEVGYLSQEVINEILAATPEMDETLELAIALPVEVWTFAVRIFVAVINRYRSGSEHGLLGTVLEEIYRSAYIDRIGKIFLWDQMKENARSAYDVNPANVDPHDDFHGGALFLDLLKRYVDHKGPIELNLIGHSAGCIHISHFIRRAAEVLEEKNPVKNVILWAPAVNFDTFVECFVGHQEMVENLCIFTMNDEAERADRLVKAAPFLYPHSLLYLVSGLLESKPDGPVLGLAMHLQGDRHKNDPNMITYSGPRCQDHETRKTRYGASARKGSVLPCSRRPSPSQAGVSTEAAGVSRAGEGVGECCMRPPLPRFISTLDTPATCAKLRARW